MNYTQEMEKAMQSSHGVSYAVYSLKHDVRMEIEKRREKDYERSQHLVAELDRKVHS
ncbi:MAG: hypothetical protein Q8906_04665 [Bacillota bacterium]|nr:hypothetical protein [Bacillota bacterium]